MNALYIAGPLGLGLERGMSAVFWLGLGCTAALTSVSYKQIVIDGRSPRIDPRVREVWVAGSYTTAVMWLGFLGWWLL